MKVKIGAPIFDSEASLSLSLNGHSGYPLLPDRPMSLMIFVSLDHTLNILKFTKPQNKLQQTTLNTYQITKYMNDQIWITK